MSQVGHLLEYVLLLPAPPGTWFFYATYLQKVNREALISMAGYLLTIFCMHGEIGGQDLRGKRPLKMHEGNKAASHADPLKGLVIPAEREEVGPRA